MAFLRRNPQSADARNALDSIGGDAIPPDTIEAICRAWMKEEPENPKPYFQLAQAWKRHQVKTPEALAYAEKALDLLAAGQLRLHGDVFGKMTDLVWPGVYLTAAELALDQQQFAKALAYVKGSEAVDKQTPPMGLGMEAKVWERLGRAPMPGATANRNDAPPFHATSLDGKALDSQQLRGKVIVANFWFTGCGPCKAEIPDLNRLTKEFAGKDVVFLVFSLDNEDAVLRRFLKEYPFDYTIVPRAERIATQFGVQSYPSHAIIGPDGKIEAMLAGGGEHRADDLRNIIARLVRTG